MIFAFGDFELDVAANRLFRDGDPIKLEPRVFDLLRYLIEHRDRVVTKRELLDTLWEGMAVSEAVLPNSVRAIRRALGQRRDQTEPIRTEHSRGYRFTSPVRTREVRRLGSAAESHADPFVGRGEVMAPLRTALDAAAAGKGSMVLLTGAAGIGKTRVVEELAFEAEKAGIGVLRGRASEQEGAPALWPWTMVLRAGLRERRAPGRGAPSTPPRALGKLLPELADDGTAEALAAEPEAAVFQLYDAAARVLHGLCEVRPRLLVLEDLHAADRQCFELLEFVASDLGSRRMLVLATLRDDELELDQAGRRRLSALSRMRGCQRIAIGELTPAEIAQYATEVIGRELPAALVEAITDKSGGNPFFLSEIVRLLKLRLARGPDLEGGHSDLPAVEIPEVVRDVIRRRLEAAGEPVREVLALCAAIGEEFDLAVLTQASALDASQLLALLDDARDFGLLAKLDPPTGFGTGPGTRQRFAHLLIHETLYHDLPSAQRLRLHARVGEALLVIAGGDLDQRLRSVAYHFHKALPEQPERAFDYATRAARAAFRRYAYEDAAELCGWALHALDFERGGDLFEAGVRRCETMLRMGRAMLVTMRPRHAQDLLADTARLAGQLQHAELFASAVLELRRASATGPSRLSMLEEALRGLPEGHVGLRARLLSWIAHDSPLPGARRRALCEEALSLVRGLNDPTSIEVFRTCLETLSGPDDLDTYLQIAGEVLELARREGRPYWAWVGQRASLAAMMQLGDIAAAERHLQACERLADELESPFFRFECRNIRIGRLVAEGRFMKAGKEINRQAADLATRSPAQRVVIWQLQFFALLKEATRLSDMAPARETVSQRAPLMSRSVPVPASVVEVNMCRYFVEIGRLDEGRRLFKTLARKGFSDVPRTASYLGTLADLSVACAQLGEREHAETLYALLSPFADRNAVGFSTSYMASVHYFLGLLAETIGDPAAARDHFEAAVVKNREMGAQPALARSYFALSRHVRAAGDATRADELVQEARAMGEKMGMTGLLSSVNSAVNSA